jgi:hypothetical protein
MPRRITLLAAPVLAGAALLLSAPGALAAETTDVTVMTRNLFLGADLIPLATAQSGASFEQAAGGVLAEVRRGDPAARMRLVAREIAKARPDLVGLQEVSIWRTGPKGDPARARHVLVDYLKVIQRALRDRHAKRQRCVTSAPKADRLAVAHHRDGDTGDPFRIGKLRQARSEGGGNRRNRWRLCHRMRLQRTSVGPLRPSGYLARRSG